MHDATDRAPLAVQAVTRKYGYVDIVNWTVSRAKGVLLLRLGSQSSEDEVAFRSQWVRGAVFPLGSTRRVREPTCVCVCARVQVMDIASCMKRYVAALDANISTARARVCVCDACFR